MTDTAHLRARTHAFRSRPGPLSETDLRDRTNKLIRDLERRAPAGSKAARTLIRRLKSCCSEAPCNSAVCQVCSVNHQAHAMAKLETIWPAGTDLVIVSIMIEKLMRDPGGLHTLKLASIRRSLRRKLEEVGCQLIPIWAYIDISFNSHADDEYSPHWIPHFHAITRSEYRHALKDLAKYPEGKPKKASKLEAIVKRPVKIQTVKDWTTQVSYACKPIPRHRRDYTSDSSAARPGKYTLNAEQNVEFALWLSEHEPHDRHFFLRPGVAEQDFVTRKSTTIQELRSYPDAIRR